MFRFLSYFGGRDPALPSYFNPAYPERAVDPSTWVYVVLVMCALCFTAALYLFRRKRASLSWPRLALLVLLPCVLGCVLTFWQVHLYHAAIGSEYVPTEFFEPSIDAEGKPDNMNGTVRQNPVALELWSSPFSTHVGFLSSLLLLVLLSPMFYSLMRKPVNAAEASP